MRPLNDTLTLRVDLKCKEGGIRDLGKQYKGFKRERSLCISVAGPLLSPYTLAISREDGPPSKNLQTKRSKNVPTNRRKSLL